MQQQWKRLYGEMLVELNLCKAKSLPESEMAECGFRIAFRYWIKLKMEFRKRLNPNDQEEIEFFKEVKPGFTSQMEYYMIMSQGLLFVPEDINERTNYWQEESQRYKRFVDRHADFIHYYEEKRKDMDKKYFLESNNQGFLPQERVYEDRDCKSSHDHLVRGWMANRLYHDFVQAKLSELKLLPDKK